MSPSLVRCRVDAQGILISADAPLLRLQQLAGADLGDPMALPGLAQLLHSAVASMRRMSRAVMMGDARFLMTGVAQITPHGDGADIVIQDWRSIERVVTEPITLHASLPSPMGWSWETDADLNLLAMRVGASAPPLSVDWDGRPLGEVLHLTADQDGDMPIISAHEDKQIFAGQQASTGKPPKTVHDMILTGNPIFDAKGGLRGFRGIAEPAPHMDINQCPHFQNEGEIYSELRFNKRVDDALRQPLNQIISKATSIADQFDGPIRADYARYASDIAQAGRHLLGLVDDLADVQNIESPTFHLDAQNIDLLDIAQHAVSLTASQADEKYIAVRFLVPEQGCVGKGERRRVLQILINLLSNAVRYSLSETEIVVHVERFEDRISLAVSDQGPGISVEHQRVIFDKFERLGRRDSGGSGLGLYIARKLARAMGGDLTVTSRLGHGACFTLWLSAVNAA